MGPLPGSESGLSDQRQMAETDHAVEPPTGNPLPVVLFADVIGSTTLYEILGDTEAKRLIDEALFALAALTKRHGGRVIKTIGDEIMCLFASPERGFHAATNMQSKIDALPMVNGTKRRIRIGFHAGPVIEEDGDVFGDTVNVAARMSSLAKGMQIMTTRSTVDSLPAYLRSLTRGIAAVAVKGKGVDLAVCEVLWQQESALTRTLSAQSTHQPLLGGELILRHATRELTLNVKQPCATMGRDPDNGIVVNDIKASRHHARIEKRRDKFFLADHSTNGTFVRINGESEIGLRREEIMLRGSGHILFGHSDAEGTEDAVEFHVRL